jgi:hypothetical protein
MTHTHRRYSKEEIAKRGDEIYERDIRPRLKPKDQGKFVAIDIDSGEYVVAADESGASHRLRDRVPDAQIWLLRVGTRYVHRFGMGARRAKL